MKLQGKVAVVTGSATGIGKAIATGMAAEGAAVVIDYVGAPDLAKTLSSATFEAGAARPWRPRPTFRIRIK